MFINDSFLYWLREATTASLAKPINRAVFDLHTQAVIIKSCALPLENQTELRKYREFITYGKPIRIHNSATSSLITIPRVALVREGLNTSSDTYKQIKVIAT